MEDISIEPLRQCIQCQNEFPATGEYFPLSGNMRKQGLRRVCRPCYNAECRIINERKGMETPCQHCQQPFTGRRKDFCSSECRILHLIGGIGARYERLVVVGFDTRKGRKYLRMQCDCGNETIASPGNLRFGHVKSCGCYGADLRKTYHGEKAPGWKGGRRMDARGYILLHMPAHPNAMKDGYVLEHIYVMSEFLGRPLRTEDGEEVHHKHGNKSDNRIENLELWSQSQPAGQRVEDMVAFCRAYLKTYARDAARLQAAQSVAVQPSLFS